jgi:hypothetical protein
MISKDLFLYITIEATVNVCKYTSFDLELLQYFGEINTNYIALS